MSISNRTLTGRRAAAVIVAAALVMTALLGMVTPQRGQAAEEQQSTFTVYLQAGHSPSPLGSGNISNGVREVNLNEQITRKTYYALRDKGINVKLLNPIGLDSSLPSVIKDPPGEHAQYAYYSPQPAMLDALTWPERFDPSETKQADLVIALHHNAYRDSSIRGYEIYYANTAGGDYGRSQEDAVGSQRIAECIEQEFSKGFYVPPRSPAVRINNTNNGITKNAPMPAVLIETGYMTNSADMAACRSERNQETLAQRVADAVVNYKNRYYVETGQPDAIEINTKAFNVEFAESTETIRIDTTLEPVEKIDRVRAAVWPDGDEDNVKWYTLTNRGEGRYTANISIKDFDYKAGRYAVNVFALDTLGAQTRVGTGAPTATGGDRTAPTAESVSAKTLSAKSNAAILRASNVTDPAGVKNVRFCVWSEENGKDDMRWYEGIQSGSDWAASMTTTNHLDRAGKYIVEAYASDKRSNEGLIGKTEVTFAHKDVAPPELYGELLYRTIGNHLVVRATDVRDDSGVRSVRVALWSTTLNQQDLAWYKMNANGADWAAAIDLNNHKNLNGRYTMHVYATDEKGNDGLIGTLAFRIGGDVTPPTAGAITVSESEQGVAKVSISDVRDDKTGVSAVDFAIWTDGNGQDDLETYRAEKQDDGTWTAQFKAADHGGEKGPYSIHAYATDGADNRGFVASTSFTFGTRDEALPTAKSVSADHKNYTQSTAKVTIEEVADDTGIEKVWIVVSPKAETTPVRPGASGSTGVDDVRTARYEASLQEGSDGTWGVEFNWANDFTASGSYTIAAYAEDWSGKRVCVGTTEVSVTKDALESYMIMGDSTVTVAQMVNMLLKYGWSNSWYDGMTSLEFCQMYYDICEQEGVKAEVAFAQMLHETGGLRYGNLVVRSQRNFAGLGASGTVVSEANRKSTHRYTEGGQDAGIVFTTVENGIKSHVQHLKGYATKDALVLDKAPEYDRYGYMQLGCAPSLQMLAGKWATDMHYGDRVHSYIETLLSMSKTMPEIDTSEPEPTTAPEESASTKARTASPSLEAAPQVEPGEQAAPPIETAPPVVDQPAETSPKPLDKSDVTEAAE